MTNSHRDDPHLANVTRKALRSLATATQGTTRGVFAVASLILVVVGCSARQEHTFKAPEPDRADERTVGDPTVEVPDAQRTIARHLPSLRRCFEQQYAHGALMLDLTIQPDGQVTEARADGRVPREVIRCVEGRARHIHFEQLADGATAQLSVAVSILPQ